MEAALVENIQRADLNAVEKAQGFKDYLERFHMTHEQLAQRLGLARPTISNLVAILEMPQEIQDAVRVGQLQLGHAKLLKGIPDQQRQIALSKEIVARGLSVHGTEAMLKQLAADTASKSNGSNGETEHSPRESPFKTTHVQSIEDELRQKLGVKCEIKVRTKDKGQFLINFESNDDFERVLEVLRK